MATVDIPRVCIDTTVFIGYLRGQEPSVKALERAVKNSACYVTAISAYELLFGAARAKHQIDEPSLLGVTSVLPFSYAAAQQAARLHADLIHRNRDIGIKDVLIAAICLENQIPLLTSNTRHFSRVPDLLVISIDEFIENP